MKKKLKNGWHRFKNSYFRLYLLFTCSIIAGISMLINPEGTDNLIIQGVGFIWVLEGILYGIEIKEKMLIEKIKE